MFPNSFAGRTIDNQGHLVAMLEERGRNWVTDHPGQVSPAEGLIVDQRDPLKAQALARAAAELVRTSDNTDVLQLCAHLGASGHEIFYASVTERLFFGPPFPDEATSAGTTITQALANTLASKSFGEYPQLHAMALDALDRLGLVECSLFICSSSDPNDVGADLLIDHLARGTIDDRLYTTIGLLSYRIAKDRPQHLHRVATALASAPYALRELCAERAGQGNPAWWAEHEADFMAAANCASASELRSAVEPLLTNALEMLGSIFDVLGVLPTEQKSLRTSTPSESRAADMCEFVDVITAVDEFGWSSTTWPRTLGTRVRRESESDDVHALFAHVARAVASLAEHKHTHIRQQAFAVLSVAPSDVTTTTLVALATSGDAERRTLALAILADHEAPTAAPLLHDAINDPSPTVRATAWTALRSAERWPELEEHAFAEPDAHAAGCALHAVGALGAFESAERLLDVVVDESQDRARRSGAARGLEALGGAVVTSVRDRVAGAPPATAWQLATILDRHNMLRPEDIDHLIDTTVPAPVRVEAAAWLAARGDEQGRAALREASETGSSLDRVHAATKRIAIDTEGVDEGALLLIMGLWFGPERILRSVRDSLSNAHRYANGAFKSWTKRAPERPKMGAGIVELVRVRELHGLGEHLRAAVEADVSDDLTRASIAALFAEGADDASGLLTTELDRRPVLERLLWSSKFATLEGCLPETLAEVLLARPEALVVTCGVDIAARHSRTTAIAMLAKTLASERDRVHSGTGIRQDFGTAELASRREFIDAMSPHQSKLQHAFADQPSVLAAFDRVANQTWNDPSAVIIASILFHAVGCGLVELAEAIDQTLGSETPEHVRLLAVCALADLAPWRLTNRDLSPDPDHVLSAVRQTLIDQG